jgi:hypothetical protein
MACPSVSFACGTFDEKLFGYLVSDCSMINLGLWESSIKLRGNSGYNVIFLKVLTSSSLTKAPIGMSNLQSPDRQLDTTPYQDIPLCEKLGLRDPQMSS